jgi:hypothetical protein
LNNRYHIGGKEIVNASIIPHKYKERQKIVLPRLGHSTLSRDESGITAFLPRRKRHHIQYSILVYRKNE